MALAMITAERDVGRGGGERGQVGADDLDPRAIPLDILACVLQRVGVVVHRQDGAGAERVRRDCEDA